MILDRNRTCILALLAIGAVLLSGSAARANLVSYSFTAQLLSTPFPGFSPGNDSFVGSYTVDTTVAAQPNGGGPVQNAAQFAAVQSLSVSILNYTWTGAALDTLIVHHQFGGPAFPDEYAVSSTPSGPALTDINGNVLTPSIIFFGLTQSAGTLFSDASVMPLDVTLSDFNSTFFDFGFGVSGSEEVMTGFLTSFGPTATTPLPAALPLFATGIGGLGLLGWRRKRKAQAAGP